MAPTSLADQILNIYGRVNLFSPTQSFNYEQDYQHITWEAVKPKLFRVLTQFLCAMQVGDERCSICTYKIYNLARHLHFHLHTHADIYTNICTYIKMYSNMCL